MSYCPFPALGRDTAGGVATWAIGPVRLGVRRPGTRSSRCAMTLQLRSQQREQHGLGPRTTWARRCGVTTQFGVTTWLVGWVLRHTPWCRDMKAAGRATLVSRHTSWCCDMGQAIRCCDITFSVATWLSI